MESSNDKAVGCITGTAIVFGFTVTILYVIVVICNFIF